MMEEEVPTTLSSLEHEVKKVFVGLSKLGSESANNRFYEGCRFSMKRTPCSGYGDRYAQDPAWIQPRLDSLLKPKLVWHRQRDVGIQIYI
jgi:hypothetical protein